VKQLVYSFTKIFNDSTTQKDIFDEVGLPLVKDLLDGKNGLLFTYGVTGSGKTYSMIGNQQEVGILQQCLDTVFNSISFHQSKKYVSLNRFSFQIQICCQTCFNLFCLDF
jgi:kinesin family member 23